MIRSSMEVKPILYAVFLVTHLRGIGAHLFHRISDDPLVQWSVPVYKTIPIKESTTLIEKCVICKADASCSGFARNNLNLLLFDLKSNSNLSLLMGVYVNLGNQKLNLFGLTIKLL